MERFDRILLRRMEFQKAKGQLQAVAELFVNESDKYDEYTTAVNKMINEIEDNGILD